MALTRPRTERGSMPVAGGPAEVVAAVADRGVARGVRLTERAETDNGSRRGRG